MISKNANQAMSFGKAQHLGVFVVAPQVVHDGEPTPSVHPMRKELLDALADLGVEISSGVQIGGKN